MEHTPFSIIVSEGIIKRAYNNVSNVLNLVKETGVVKNSPELSDTLETAHFYSFAVKEFLIELVKP